MADAELSPSASEEKGGAKGDETIAGLPKSSSLGAELADSRAPTTLIAALIAWSVTLAPAGFGKGTPGIAAVLAVAALAAGMVGPFVARKRPHLGRHVGITLFAGLSTLTWIASPAAIHPTTLDPVRGVCGAIAWGVYALSWSDRWGQRREAAPADPEAGSLLARATLPALATPLAGFGLLVALGFLTLAWRVREPERALVSQSVAILCGVGVVTAAATVAIARGKRRATTGRRLSSVAVRALVLLVAAAVAGAVVAVVR